MEHNETRVEATGFAPSVASALTRATRIAAENGRTWAGVEDLLVALLTAQPVTPLEMHWEKEELGALTFAELVALAKSIVPGTTAADGAPAASATVAFSATGPESDAFTEQVARA
ncbi:hypothetical protein [Nocardia camponoti]|uniref:Uncharacterized protein n=1 Tax=Nocardia camponoti TaxID=1616106 RepID=A0A917QT93_9NOCA|nr:hypothetical protein [Nocardia camponoti]GGK66845.1 hypothetical protein GCM10011591_43750 [Nocardia camponoti]